MQIVAKCERSGEEINAKGKRYVVTLSWEAVPGAPTDGAFQPGATYAVTAEEQPA